MRLRPLYLNFKKQRPKPLYHKMINTYTAIVVCIAAALTLYFITDAGNRLLAENQAEMERISRDAYNYIEETGRTADYIHGDLYRSPSELYDLLEYFRLGPQEYQEYSLRRYIASIDLVYKGIFRFLNETFEAHRQLEKIELISYQTLELTECLPQKNVYPGKNGKPRMKQIQNNRFSKEGKLVYLKEIRHPDTMKPAGCILFTFEGEKKLEDIRSRSPYANMAVFRTEDEVIFQQPETGRLRQMLQDRHYFVCTESVREHQIYVFMDERQASFLPVSRLLLFLAVGAAVSAAGILYIHYYVKRLTRRVDRILDAMDRVTTGDFKVRLAAGGRQDELDMIAADFNGMCEKLQLYIEKSYLEEIERKNAQMQALQSQINPHFLYNTLEAIRMKAICNGDREVGKMLYSMVVLFRSQLKEADVITLGQELDYCKQYMELFEYRYQNSFQSRVDCPPELLSLPVIKFVLQPVIENYFIHGIQRDRADNLVRVWAERTGDTLYLNVEDNGCGMDEQLLEQKNRQLRDNVMPDQTKESIGIQNVNRRIKAVYGDRYGISIQAAAQGGLLVVLRLKAEG